MDGSSAVTETSYNGTQQSQTTGKGAAGLGEDDFYTLLVAQMQNQNPLEPMSNEDYIAQLAQFASLAQLSSVNENLTYLQMYQASVNNTLSVSLVGKTVKADTNEIRLEDGKCNEIWCELDSNASEVKLQVKDEDGTVVREETFSALEAGEHVFEWDGKDSDGNAVSDGEYTFEVTAKDEDGESVGVKSGIRARVTGIAFDQGITYLIMNGQKVPLSEVSEIQEGESSNDE
ncbi:MAG TPA: FlgD immunoglobulin-like domain containing protein [bacterium]|nr:FlgD immunoglobulin-like domain containing protein [bacterium]